ncbi:MAG TPA: MerR family transcriptional regulator [Acidimicrobiales bacterium]|nr:MerR family transcriptional regulator [Acidimicrobiales bacterium]
MTRAPSDRSHLSIGEVLSLLQGEFPDVTISKIRFLESQGLLDPERTPSGYRKFYEADIDRLRWILRQQKDHYLPLKVIKDRLEDSVPSAVASRSANNGVALAAADGGTGSESRSVATAVALDERPGIAPPADDSPTHAAPLAAPVTPAGPASDSPVQPRAQRPVGAPADRTPRPTTAPEQTAAAHRSSRTRVPAPAPPGAVSLTAEELAQHSGLAMRDLRDLERYGLIESFAVGDSAYYDADALVIAQTAAGFLQHGIEARHMRSYKVAVDREAGLFEQIVLPLLKQRNPEARQRARETIAELVRLGQQMRGVLLSRELRDVAGPA